MMHILTGYWQFLFTFCFCILHVKIFMGGMISCVLFILICWILCFTKITEFYLNLLVKFSKFCCKKCKKKKCISKLVYILDLSKLVWICVNLSKLVQTYLNLSKLVKTCSNLSKLVKTWPNWSKLAQKGQKLFLDNDTRPKLGTCPQST